MNQEPAMNNSSFVTCETLTRQLPEYLAGALSALYLINPTAGIVELLPDNIPFIGNIDEATATMVLLAALRYFGWDFADVFRKRTERLN